jgi:hypothetical protein
MDKFKLEIIDNQISNCYEYKLSKFKKVNKWYEFERWEWRFEQAHSIGKKYMCPAIYKKQITIEQMFNREVENLMEDKNIEEVHRIKITRS